MLAPLRVKSFAGACGQLAKTDPLDAELIRKFAETYTPDETPYDKQRFDLQEVVNARKQLVKNRATLRQNLQTATTAVVVKALRLQCNALDRQIKMLEDEIRALLREKAKTDSRVEALATEYSVGLVLLATLFAYFDEIGTLGRKRAASLSGTAPHPRDSGAFHSKRFIRGGRAVVRQAFYVSSTALLLKGSPLRPVYDALRARGLTHRAAQCALVRRFIVHLDTVARNALKNIVDFANACGQGKGGRGPLLVMAASVVCHVVGRAISACGKGRGLSARGFPGERCAKPQGYPALGEGLGGRR